MGCKSLRPSHHFAQGPLQTCTVGLLVSEADDDSNIYIAELLPANLESRSIATRPRL